MAKGISAIPKNIDVLSEKEARWSGWDPELSVPIVEPLVYAEDGETAILNKLSQPTLAGTSAGTGMISVAAFGYSGTSYRKIQVGTDDLLRVYQVSGTAGTVTLSADASGNRVSAFSNDAGLLRVSAVGGSTVTFDGDAANNRVSAVQRDAANLNVSAKSIDAGTMRVSAIGVSVTTSPLSADSSSISAIQEGANRLRVSAVQDDAANLDISAKSNDASTFHVSAKSDSAALFRVSALGVTLATAQALSATLKEGTAFVGSISANQAGTWSISSLLKEGTAFVGQVSSKSTDAGTMLVSAKQGDAALHRVSAFSPDAATFRVSAIGVTVTTPPLSADSSSISAIQEGANRLRVSAIQDDASNFDVSAKSDSAATFRVSAFSNDAGTAHVSAYQGGTWSLTALLTDSTANIGSVSAKSDNAGQARVSAFSDSAALFRVSALGVTLATAQALSATLKEGTSFVGSVSANQAGTWAISALAKEGTSFIGSVSANQAGTWAISALAKEGTSFIGNVSAKNADSAANFRVSAFVDSGSISAKSNDAGQLRVSADLFVDTTGNLTIFRSISLSASQAVKGSAGALYGYYLANTDTKFNYIKFYNTSGAINVGTDTPVLTVPIPPSAAANMEFTHGLVGFTNGIGVVALSAVADNATTSSPASAVIGNIFYK